MDYDKLIERLHKEAYGSDIEDLLLDAATAIETIQAENARLRGELEYEQEHANAYHEECGQWEAENEKLRAELEQVKAERDAAVDDLTFAVNKYRLFTTDINLCYLCKFNFPSSGENEQTYECPGCYGDDCFEWRGPQKED